MADRGTTAVIDYEAALAVLLDGRDMPSYLVAASDVFVRNAFGYWLSARQDMLGRVQWVSFTPDLAQAPAGHTYTELQIEARWLL